MSLSAQKPLLIERPDIVIATPGRAVEHLKANNFNLKSGLEVLVVDETDLVFSFGYEEDLKNLLNFMPNIYQAIMASATLSTDVKTLKKLVLHNPIILKLEEPDLPPTTQLTHYHLSAEENDKAAILYALLKLHLVRGKTIIFVNTVDRCYKLKLYLEQFGIKSCVLNSELPATIRCHSVNQFNQGIYDIIVASDEQSLENPGMSTSKRNKDKESGVARGIDFQFICNVINFDFPLNIDSYIHRAGRTARGINEGSVLSFISIKEQLPMQQVEEHLCTAYATDSVIKTYQFRLEEVESFRYRARDAWRAVTRIAVREARLKEIKLEILNCSKLKGYFEDNPRDLEVLRHDKALHTVKVQKHLSNVPDYIVPNALKNYLGVSTKSKRRFSKGTKNSSSLRCKAKLSNPLMSMELSLKKRKK